jgi:hypothetical protein
MSEQTRHPIGRFALECLETGMDEPFVLSRERSVTLALVLTAELDRNDPDGALQELLVTAHFVDVALAAPRAARRILETIEMVLGSRRTDASMALSRNADILKQRSELLGRFEGQAPAPRIAPKLERKRDGLTIASFPRARISGR